MCNTWKYPTSEGEEITADLLRKLPRGMRFANITGGEPFLRGDIEEAVGIMKSKTRRLVISTNGYFTDAISDLAKRNRDIGFRISLEGLPAANDELRGLKDGFDHGLRTLIRLHELGIKDIGFGITMSDRNAGDLLELYGLARWLGVEFATAAVHNGYYFHKFDNVINEKAAIERALTELIGLQMREGNPKSWFRAYFNHGLIRYINGGKRLLPCAMGSDVFLLDPLGEIRPCNAMEETMGNLNESSFDEIWYGERADRVRRSVENCQKNCWMVGSAAPAMKKEILKPAFWVLRNKGRSA